MANKAREQAKIVVKVSKSPANFSNSSWLFSLAETRLGTPIESKTSTKIIKTPSKDKAIKKASV